jgi:phosphate transport system substrate-binding protein
MHFLRSCNSRQKSLPYHRSRSIIELARSVQLRRTLRLRLVVGAGLLALSLILAGCGGGASGQEDGVSGGDGASGQISIEGSSTVQPITQAVAEGFAQENPDVQITVGGAGTGDGFEAFCSGDTQISDASRPIEAEEIQVCKDGGVEYIEIPVAYDGISVVVNSQNDFATAVTSAELKTLWEPAAEGKITTWKQVRSEWPDQQITLYGPGTESGTFDFFTEKINGAEGASRTDYQASEDDNVLVQGVSGDPNALGYFGFSYYENNQDTLKALAVDGVEPNTQSIRSTEYSLSRPLFIYVSAQALKENKAVEPFVDFYLQNLDEYVEQARYVTLPRSLEQEARTQWENRTTGTVYNENGELPGGDLEAALKQSQ